MLYYTKKSSILLCLLVACFATAGEPSSRFYVEGDVYSESNLTQHGKALPKTVTHFQLNYEDCKWQIQTERNIKDSRTGQEFNFKFIAGTTNSDIFAVSYFRQTGSTNWKCSDASARPGPIPYVLMDPTIQMLWVAFISQCHYKSDGRQMLAPVFFPYPPELYNAQFFMPADVNHNDSFPYFISNITTYVDKWRYWQESQDALVMPPLERPLPPPYENGCTNFVYCVREFNHNETLTWPSKFNFVFFGMKSGASSSADLTIVDSVNGTATSFDTNTHAQISSFIPEIVRGTIVNESRFISDENPVSSFNYFSTGAWQSKAEITNSIGFKKQMQNQALLKPLIQSRPHIQTALNAGALKKRAWIVLAVMTIVSIIPLLFFVKGIKSTNKN